MDAHLLRFREDQKYIVFDFETCNANTNTLQNKAWQLGCLIAKGSKIVEEKTFYLQWDPLPICKGAARVTNFDWNVYKRNAQDPELALDFLNSYLFNSEYRILGHNILGFDVYIYNILCKLLGRKTDYSFLPRFIDTDAFARGIKNDYLYKSNNKEVILEDLLAYQYRAGSIIKKGCKTNLMAMGSHYKINFDVSKLHDAGADTRLNFDVWNKMKWEIEI